MYVELIKIIEGGIENDRQKVMNYSKKMIDVLESTGDTSVARNIERLLKSKNTRLSTLDSLTAKPLDKDSSLDMVEVSIPTESDESLYFDYLIEKEVSDFLEGISMKEDFLKHGLNIENRLLLYGPPGTGKTSLARFISLQTGLPLVTVKLDALISSMLGSTAKNIRKIFEYSSRQPCILFLDEFDVLAKVRDDKNELGELKRVVNSLLQNIDYFSNDSILIAATNHEKLLDTAVWRRFNTVLQLSLPSNALRKDIIQEYSKILPTDYLHDSKKLNQLSDSMVDLSPADIKNIIQKTAKRAIISGQNKLHYSNIVYQTYTTKSSSNLTNEEVIKDLLFYKVPQREIASLLNVSLRQVRNIVQGVRENE
ncbi:AAA family ATPase [Salinicoccus sp. CNSTN-B1]